jgi:cytochrome P450
MRDPIAFYADARERWGDPVRIKSPNGKILMTGRPDLIREIFAADPMGFDPWGSDALAPLLGRESLLLLRGERHARERKLLMPPFHGARMRAYGLAMRAAAKREIATWRPDRTFDVLEAMQRISLAVIVETIFGVRDEARAAQWTRAIIATIDALSPLIVFLTWLRRDLLGLSPWRRFRKRVEALDAMIHAEIAARRAAPDEGEDVLALLLGARYEDGSPMTDTAIRDQLVTLLFAGHETTAVSLCWALYELARDEALHKRVVAEIGSEDAPEALTRLPLLDAVCQETLRRHPVVADIARQPVGPTTLDGRPVPSDTALMPAIAWAHFDPAIFPEPDRFRPDRFLEGKFTPFEFFPFGGGARRCIGAAFAIYEMKLVLVEVLRSGRLTLTKAAPVRHTLRGITLGPKGGMPMRFLPRTQTRPSDVSISVMKGEHDAS